MIGGMGPSTGTTVHARDRRAVRWLTACLALAVAAMAAGCDAEPAPPSAPDHDSLLGRSASELDETNTDDVDETDADELAPPDRTETVGVPGGGSPLDPRAEPDPIPWTPRIAHGNDA